jgi:glycosyltransferase involved in cell wall biosynthesis
MKAGAILPHTHLYGGVKRFIELGRIFNEAGHTFTLYTPVGLAPSWTRNDVRVASFDDLENEYNDMLFATDRKYKKILLKARAGYKIFYHVSLHHKARKMIREKRFHIFACSSNVVQYDRLVFRRVPFLAAGGVDTELFNMKQSVGNEKKYEFTILVYGRIHERVKGTKLVVRACEKLYKKYPFIRLILFDTPVNNSMSEAIDNFNTHVPFQFITNHPVEENAALFHQADIFVAAEKGAGWANTVAEAMSCGIPVVATKSGTADILIDGITGIRVSRNVHSIARGISKLITSPELRETLAVNGRKHIEKFTWQILARKIMDWYDNQENHKKKQSREIKKEMPVVYS